MLNRVNSDPDSYLAEPFDRVKVRHLKRLDRKHLTVTFVTDKFPDAREIVRLERLPLRLVERKINLV